MWLNFLRIFTDYFINLHLCYNFCNFYGQTQQRAAAKKQSSTDLSTCEDQIWENPVEVDDKKNTEDKFEVQEINKLSGKIKEEAKNTQLNSTAGSTTTLPDIVNVQPSITTKEADDSIISSLSKNLSNLRIDTKGNSTLTIPTSCDAISSDEEIFAECQSYSDQTAPLGSNINRSIHWDAVLSTVSSSNLDNLDNTTEQVDTNLDLDQHQESIADSTSRNTDINPSNIPESYGSEAECIEVRTFNSSDSTLKNEIETEKFANLNRTVDLKVFCKEALSICSDDENVDVTSSVPTLSETATESNKLSKNYCFPIKTELTKTKKTQTQINDNQNNETHQSSTNEKVTSTFATDTASDCKTAKNDDSIANKSNSFNSADQLNMLEKSVNELNSSKEGDTLSDQSLVDIQLSNQTMDKSKSSLIEFPCLNQIINIQADVILGEKIDILNPLKSEGDRQSAEEFEKQLNETVPAITRSLDPDSLFEELNRNAKGNELDKTFAVKTEALNTTTDNEVQLNGTFDAKRSELALNETIELTSPAVEKIVNDAVVFKSSNISLNDKNNKIALDNIESNLSVEPMDVDAYSPVRSESISAKCTATNPEKHVISQDVFVENLTNPIDVTFKTPSMPNTTAPIGKRKSLDEPLDSDFQGQGIILNPSDFDFLLTKGNNSVEIDGRNSLLLRFDPLLGHAVPVNQSQVNNHNQLATTSLISPQHLGRLSPSIEEDDDELNIFISSKKASPQCSEKKKCNVTNLVHSNFTQKRSSQSTERNSELDINLYSEVVSQPEREPLLARRIQSSSGNSKKDDKMSVDVIQGLKIENDTKSQENISPKSDEKKAYKMDDLEKKIKNEVLKTEDIEKKLKDAEQREEALLKRITEKDKTISKMSGVIEAYEKAIAELIAEKEQIIQNYEKQMSEIKSERDLNYQHLTSLESTFSDLHVKYERSKQLTSKLKTSEEDLKTDKKQNLENLRLQEQRYEKMKNHAMQQLEIANNKLESLTKNHSMEVTRLKALLKKEEIARLSITEQLQQKSRENEELMKICDELINGQGASS